MIDGAVRPSPSFHHEAKSVADSREPLELDENALLRRWQPDLLRAAARGAARMRARPDDVQDFAQDAGFRLIMAVRKTGLSGPHYLRKVIRNAVVSSIRRERRAITTISPRGEQLSESLEAPDFSVQAARDEAIASWTNSLPTRLRQLHEMLYERGMTQRQAAAELGLSQSRVAQLHRELLNRGRLELAYLVA